MKPVIFSIVASVFFCSLSAFASSAQTSKVGYWDVYPLAEAGSESQATMLLESEIESRCVALGPKDTVSLQGWKVNQTRPMDVEVTILMDGSCGEPYCQPPLYPNNCGGPGDGDGCDQLRQATTETVLFQGGDMVLTRSNGKRKYVIQAMTKWNFDTAIPTASVSITPSKYCH